MPFKEKEDEIRSIQMGARTEKIGLQELKNYKYEVVRPINDRFGIVIGFDQANRSATVQSFIPTDRYYSQMKTISASGIIKVGESLPIGNSGYSIRLEKSADGYYWINTYYGNQLLGGYGSTNLNELIGESIAHEEWLDIRKINIKSVNIENESVTLEAELVLNGASDLSEEFNWYKPHRINDYSINSVGYSYDSNSITFQVRDNKNNIIDNFTINGPIPEGYSLTPSVVTKELPDGSKYDILFFGVNQYTDPYGVMHEWPIFSILPQIKSRETDIKTYFSKMEDKDVYSGIAITGSNASAQILGILRDRTEEISGGMTAQKRTNILTWRFKAGITGDKISAALSADKEKQEINFKGRIEQTKTGFNLTYTRTDVKGKFSEYIGKDTNIQVDQSLLDSEKTKLTLELVYTGHDRTVNVVDATNKEYREILTPTIEAYIEPSKWLKIKPKVGAEYDIESKKAKTTAYGVVIESGPVKAELAKTAFETKYWLGISFKW